MRTKITVIASPEHTDDLMQLLRSYSVKHDPNNEHVVRIEAHVILNPEAEGEGAQQVVLAAGVDMTTPSGTAIWDALMKGVGEP